MKIRRLLFVLFFVPFFVSCTKEKQKQDKQETLVSEAWKQLEKIDRTLAKDPSSRNSLDLAIEGSRIAVLELNDFKKATRYYTHLVFYSPLQEERLSAQKSLAKTYLENLNDPTKAIVELNRLLPLAKESKQKREVKMLLARAYFYQNNFKQAELEVDEYLKTGRPGEDVFDLKMLKANIRMAQKDTPGAALILRDLLLTYPERSIKENVGVTLALAYEESKDYRSAIDVLEGILKTSPQPEYIEIRINRLKERLKNQPGARGFRK